MLQDIQTILTRDLDKLYQEIDAFQEEANLWETSGNVANSAGNLCLHLCGNLNTYIGAILGNSGYERDRPAEFSLKDIPKSQLLEQVQQTKEMVKHTLEQLQQSDLTQEYPKQVFSFPMTNGYFLLHLSVHLGYHLGQINYLRRVLA